MLTEFKFGLPVPESILVLSNNRILPVIQVLYVPDPLIHLFFMSLLAYYEKAGHTAQWGIWNWAKIWEPVSEIVLRSRMLVD